MSQPDIYGCMLDSVTSEDLTGVTIGIVDMLRPDGGIGIQFYDRVVQVFKNRHAVHVQVKKSVVRQEKGIG